MSSTINETLSDFTPTQLVAGTLGACAALYASVNAVRLYRFGGKDALVESLFGPAIRLARRTPGGSYIDSAIAEEQRKMEAQMRAAFGHDDPTELKISTIPDIGYSYDEILAMMDKTRQKEESKWKKGFVSGAVYDGSDEHTEFLIKAYGMAALTNPLHADVFPGVRRYEAQIIAMTNDMMRGPPTPYGATTSGGTESILMAVRAYKEQARANGILHPNLVACENAHAAFDKACQYMDVELRKAPMDAHWQADVAKMAELIDANTIALVGSAPSFPHGTVDDIPAIAALAKQHGIGCHSDCCLGGFVLPWAIRLGYTITPFDFTVDGVTSISVDTHKYGYAAKGTSVVLFSSPELRKRMYFVAPSWPGGIYASPTMPGSRPGALLASCWGSLLAIGKKGYLERTEKLLQTAKKIADGMRAIPELEVIGAPQSTVVAFRFKNDAHDVYLLSDFLSQRGWTLNTLQKPACIHICVTMRTVLSADRFIQDLADGASTIRDSPSNVTANFAPVYGLLASLPDRSMVVESITTFLDVVLSL